MMLPRWGRRRPSPWFAAAAILALLAALGTMRAAASGERAPILVAAEDLAVGDDLSDPARLRVVQVPAGAKLPGLLTDAAAIAGRRLAVPVARDEPLTDAALGGRPGIIPAPLAAGERAVSVPASAAGAALPVLVPGARVDVVGALADNAETQVVVEGAEVIVQQVAVDPGAGSDVGAILLRVSATDALRLSAALDRATGVRVLPRAYADRGTP